jgi:hypothetical protein
MAPLVDSDMLESGGVRLQDGLLSLLAYESQRKNL